MLAVDDDGTIHYVHQNLNKGVVIEMMNLLQPDMRTDDTGKTLNSAMAIPTKAGGPRAEHWLAGDVFNAFGDVLTVRDYYTVTISDSDAQPEPMEHSIALVKQE